MRRLRLIVPCTKRKQLPGSRLAMRQLDPLAFVGGAELAEHWWGMAQRTASEQSLPAGSLYRGAQWPLIEAARHHCNAHLLILSAGLGLLSEDDPVPGYDATFSRGLPDTVTLPGMTMSQAHQYWWKFLGTRRLVRQSDPRTLEALMASDPRDSYLIVASPPYAQAIALDLLAGALHLEDPRKQLLVVSSGHSSPLPTSMVLRSRNEMREALGGGLLTLNMKLAAEVMTQFKVSEHLGEAASRALAKVSTS